MKIDSKYTCSLASPTETPSAKTCMNCMVRRLSLFDDLSEPELSNINRNRSVATYRAGESIYKQGTRPMGLICLAQGKVKVIMDGISGAEQIIALKKPVDFLGFPDLVGEDIYQTSAIALEETAI